MNVVESVRELFSLAACDPGASPVVTIPDEWRPAGGDLIPHPGQKVERVIQRVKRDGNVTIYEQEVIFIREPQARPEPEPERPTFRTVRVPAGTPIPAESYRVYDAWLRGEAVWTGGSDHPGDCFITKRR